MTTASNDVPVVIALDIGSSSIRCSAYRVLGKDGVKMLDQCYTVRQLKTVESISGKIRLTTEQGTDLLDEIDGIVDDVLQKLRELAEPTKVLGLGFASFCMNLIALDALGHPVGQEATISYSCSTSDVGDECRWLKSYLGCDREKEMYERTGAPLHSAYALPQLRRLYSKPENADIVGRIAVWQTISSACLTRWRGTPFSHVSFSEASWTGLFNFRTCEWDREAVSLLPEECKNKLPPLCDYCDDVMPSGGIRPESVREDEPLCNPYWDRWPELRGSAESDDAPGCRIFFGLGDGACANIGSNCCNNQKFSVTIGTSAAARVCVPMRPSIPMDSFYIPDGLFCYRIDRSHALVGGALTDGGSVIEWARKLLNLENDDEFALCLGEVEQLLNKDYENCSSNFLPASSISVAPFLSGERSVGFRDGATFSVTGITTNTTRAQFLKACLEGVILRLEAVLRLLREGIEAGRRKPRIIVSGAALEKNALWRQMLADCSGLQVQFDTEVRESTSKGAAIMVAVALAMERDMSRESTSYLAKLSRDGESIFYSPRLSITENYWIAALDDQENFIDAISTLW